MQKPQVKPPQKYFSMVPFICLQFSLSRLWSKTCVLLFKRNLLNLSLLPPAYEPVLSIKYAVLAFEEECVAQWLTPRTPDLEVRGSSLARRVVLLDKELYSTWSLFTGSGAKQLGVPLRWTRKERQYS